MASSYKVPLSTWPLTSEEENAVLNCLRSQAVTMGKECAAFEREFAEMLGCRHAVMVNSGSSANLIAFFALANPLVELSHGRRIKPGDEVIVPAVSWGTTIWPIIQAGAIPVLCDSDPETLQVRPSAIKDALSDRTAAICAVHMMGNSVDIDPIRQIADDNGHWLVEDTCEALATTHNGKSVGTYGVFGTFSLFFSHQITTIEGGMVVTNDDGLADLARGMRAHGWARDMKDRDRYAAENPRIDVRHLFATWGFNLRPTDLNGAIGRVQLTRLAAMNKSRRAIADKWTSAFDRLSQSGMMRPMRLTEGTVPARLGYPVLCDTGERRDAFRAHLENNGIETRPIMSTNMARQPAMRQLNHRVSGSLEGADAITDRAIYWGCSAGLEDEKIDHVINTVKHFFRLN